MKKTVFQNYILCIFFSSGNWVPHSSYIVVLTLNSNFTYRFSKNSDFSYYKIPVSESGNFSDFWHMDLWKLLKYYYLSQFDWTENTRSVMKAFLLSRRIYKKPTLRQKYVNLYLHRRHSELKWVKSTLDLNSKDYFLEMLQFYIFNSYLDRAYSCDGCR